MVKNKTRHERYMRLALELAKKAEGQTSPNPLVGAVVVNKGRIVGRGYHRAWGQPHAEAVALEQAGNAARAGSLYVTLEPCCHFGQTPPCVDKIIASGVKEVIFAMSDPNPLNNGRGSGLLRRQGIKVYSGILEDQAKAINQVFLKYITKKLPFVTVKVAQSLDGKIATKERDSRWISSQASREFAHRLRAQVDAILVGINTILQDNPLLSCRLNGKLHKRQPKKVIVDTRLRLPLNAKIFSSRSPAQVIVATTKFAPKRKILKLRKRTQIMVVKEKNGKVDLKDLLNGLAQQGIAHILVEGGGEIIASLLKDKLVDKMMVVVAPKIIGGRSAPTSVEGAGIRRMKEAMRLGQLKLSRLDGDLLIEGRPG